MYRRSEINRAISLILAFVGTKTGIHAFHGAGLHGILGLELPHIAIEVSLEVVRALLIVIGVACLTATRKNGTEIV